MSSWLRILPLFLLAGLRMPGARAQTTAATQPRTEAPDTARFAGQWQGTLAGTLRVILRLDRSDASTGSGWKGTMYSIDQGPEGVPVEKLAVAADSIRFAIASFHLTYEGTLSPDGNFLNGTVTQGKSTPLALVRATKETAWATDQSPHTVQFVQVEPGVRLEVLDWGGTGRPLVFIPGLGNDAHVFDKFAPQFTGSYHVYGITRRGFGASSRPEPTTLNYRADRLGDDVLAVLNALHLEERGKPRPVLVGHSLGGEELSSIGSRHPEDVAGLIYLDAGYAYAFYDAAHGSAQIDLADLRSRIDLALSGRVQDQVQFTNQLLASLVQTTRDVQQTQKDLAAKPPPKTSGPHPPIVVAILSGAEKYTHIPVPSLAIYAVPHDFDGRFKNDPDARAALIAEDTWRTTAQADAFAAGVPTARVVRIANANHYVFRSNGPQVVTEMNGS